MIKVEVILDKPREWSDKKKIIEGVSKAVSEVLGVREADIRVAFKE